MSAVGLVLTLRKRYSLMSLFNVLSQCSVCELCWIYTAKVKNKHISTQICIHCFLYSFHFLYWTWNVEYWIRETRYPLVQANVG